MGVICPVDLTICPDDLCHGGACVRSGEEPYQRCQDCGGLSEGGFELCEDCEMDQEHEDEYEEWKDS